MATPDVCDVQTDEQRLSIIERLPNELRISIYSLLGYNDKAYSLTFATARIENCRVVVIISKDTASYNAIDPISRPEFVRVDCKPLLQLMATNTFFEDEITNVMYEGSALLIELSGYECAKPVYRSQQDDSLTSSMQ